MNYCPLMSFQREGWQKVYCLGDDCALAADAAGECLIKQALQCYVSKERTIAEKEQEICAITHNLDHISRTPVPLDFYTYRIEPSSQCISSNDFVGWGGLQEGP